MRGINYNARQFLPSKLSMKKLSLTLLSLIFLSACASQPADQAQIQAEKMAHLQTSPSTWNAAPSEAFSAFGKFELEALKLTPELQADRRKQAVSGIAEKAVSDRINLLIEQWQTQSNGDRVLLITPTLTQFKIVSKGARFWAGAFAGDSSAKMEVVISDKATGEIIASPFFFQSANAYAAAWSFGSHDQSIPERLAVLLEKYLADNFKNLQGGPTGKDA